MEKLFDIIREDSSLLVVNKPADLVCHPTKGDVYSSLISRVRLYLGPSAEAHLINRLDRETSGLVLVAKSLPVAVEIRRLWERRLVCKYYLAIVRGRLREAGGLIDAPLGCDDQSLVAIKDKVRADGASSRTQFLLLARFSRAEGDFSLLQVHPLTGRKHQIRIHLADYGHPIVGDKLYGGDENLYLDFVQGRLTEAQRRKLLLPNQALHAGEVRFEWRGREAVFRAPPEPWFKEFVGLAMAGSLNDPVLSPQPAASNVVQASALGSAQPQSVDPSTPQTNVLQSPQPQRGGPNTAQGNALGCEHDTNTKP